MTKLYIDIDYTEIRQQIKLAADRHISNQIGIQCREFFANGTCHGQKGIGYSIMQKIADDYILSPEFEKKVEETVLRTINAAMEEAAGQVLNKAIRKRIVTETLGKIINSSEE